MNSLMGGRVKIYFALVPAVLRRRPGALRAIAVTTEERLPYLPDVPTIAELGFPGYEISSSSSAFCAPAGTPKDVVGKMTGELVRMLNVPEIRRRTSQEGASPSEARRTLSRPGSRTRSPSGPR